MFGKVWNEEMINELRRLVMASYKSSIIAKMISSKFGINITRNSIIGAVSRHLDQEARNVFSQNAPTPGVNSNDKVKKVVIKKQPTITDVEHYEHNEDGIALVDLIIDQCRWPITKRSPHRFCGLKRVDGKPYCEEHCAISLKVRTV